MLEKLFVKVFFARMAERRVADIVPKRDRLDKLKVKVERLADGARDSRNKLNVKSAAGQIIVFIKRKHLRFIGIAVIIRAMQYLVDIANKRRPQNRWKIMPVIAPQNPAFIKSKAGKRSVFSVVYYSVFGFFG